MHIHLGFAIALKGGGLVAPAIHDVDTKSCDELMAALRDVIPRARRRRLRSSEMTDATITVTNLGDLGVETVFGVIYPPQVALVGFGAIIEQPWAEHGMLGVRPVLTASLAADHRATDGHLGAQFLDALNRHLQAPGDAMTDAELTRIIFAELRKVAPEADPAALAPEQTIRDTLDIDSFDFLSFLIALSKATGVEVPEADYAKLATIDGMVSYFRERQ